MQHTISAIDYALTDFTDTTSSAFLVAALRWAQEQGVWQPFRRLLALDMKTVTYSPLQKVQTLIASIMIGCRYNSDINTRLVPDQVAAALLGLARFPDQSQLNLLLRRFDATNLSQLQAIHADLLPIHEPLQPRPHWRSHLMVDIDQCGLVAGGKSYQLAAKGYFPRQRGAHGYQLGAAWLGSSGVTLGLRLAPGNTHCSRQLVDLVEQVERQCEQCAAPRVYRLDAGYGGQAQLGWLLAHGHLVLAKSATKRADRWAAKVAPGAGQAVPGQPGVQVAEVAAGPQLRAIVSAVLQDGLPEYAVLLTNLPAEFAAAEVWQLYVERQTIEAFFKLGRGVYGMDNLRSRQFSAIYGFLWLVFITHNLLQWVKRGLFGDTELADIGTRELVEKLGTLPARREYTPTGWRLLLPSHSRLAQLFVQILRPQWVQAPLRL